MIHYEYTVYVNLPTPELDALIKRWASKFWRVISLNRQSYPVYDGRGAVKAYQEITNILFEKDFKEELGGDAWNCKNCGGTSKVAAPKCSYCGSARQA